MEMFPHEKFLTLLYDTGSAYIATLETNHVKLFEKDLDQDNNYNCFAELSITNEDGTYMPKEEVKQGAHEEILNQDLEPEDSLTSIHDHRLDYPP